MSSAIKRSITRPSRPPVHQKRKGRAGSGAPEGRVFLYGLHTVEEALKKHSYNISLAAAELGLTRASLYRRMEKHGL